MSFSGGSRSTIYSSLVVLLIIVSILHIWGDCRVMAIRILPESTVAKEEEGRTLKPSASQAEVFRKFFNGRVSDLNNTGEGFQENKRRVPSCPDPLHNK